MTIPAIFPTTVWDGTSLSRPNTDYSNHAPDYADYNQITAEVIAIETELLSLDSSNVKTLSDVAVLGGIPLVYRIDIADGSANTDVVVTDKIRVIDVVVVKTAADGGSGDTVQVKNSSTAITDAMSLNAVDKTVVRAGTINDASHEIAAGGTLRVTAVSSTNCACIAYVHAVKVP